MGINRELLPADLHSSLSENDTRLSLANRGLVVWPDWLSSISGLTSLDLHGNNLSALPANLDNLANLTTLNLSSNQLEALPSAIGNLTKIKELFLENNKIVTLPESMCKLKALTQLFLDKNRLAILPEWIGDLPSLEGLYLRGNQLSAVPESLCKLSALRLLYLHDNQLGALPEQIGNLSALQVLYLRNNNIAAIPISIGNLRALRTLNIGMNRLAEVPESIGNLRNLAELYLNNNHLTSVPDSLGNLTILTKLSLSSNRLTTLPRTLADRLTKGMQLEVGGNRLNDPLPELAHRGADALAAYLRSLDDAIAHYEAKLLLVGEGNVGKTSLVAALRGVKFVDGRPTTHGIEIWPITIHHPDLDIDMTLRAWDFGGQEVYRVTHQFFFSRRALYTVVWNSREGQEQNEVEDWLRRIRLRVGHDAQALIVATHCEDRLPELDYPNLTEAFPDMLVGSFEVDNRTGSGISQLRQAIGLQAAKLPQMGQLISPRWLAARDAILVRSKSEPQIQFRQFAKICEDNGVIDQEITTLAELMHDLGHIIYYGEDEGLKDIVVLNPEWLTKAISYVLEDKATKDDSGVLNHRRLKQIWPDRADGLAYPYRYHPYFLRLMEKFDISYRLEGEELYSLVAQLVPHERPVLPWQARTHPPRGIRSLALTCRLSEPAPGLIPWLTVRHHRASTGKHWRRGVFLRHPIDAYESEALVELRRPSELTVEVRAPSPDLYFNVLRDSIEDLITRRWPGLTYQLFIPCPQIVDGMSMCKGQFPLDGLLRLRERGLVSVPCMECAEVHQVSLLLTGFTTPGLTLDAELQQVHNNVARVNLGVAPAEGQAAEIGDSVRRALQVISSEVADCPRLFTVGSIKSARRGDKLVDLDHCRLTLWCEQPGYWHPWAHASYDLNQSSAWVARIKPYATLIHKTLQLVIPIVGFEANVLLRADQLTRARREMQLMKDVLDELPDRPYVERAGASLTDVGTRLSPAEGEALQAVRTLLFERDLTRTFGGLRRVVEPSGDSLWVCEEHYPEYDPGLPKVPRR